MPPQQGGHSATTNTQATYLPKHPRRHVETRKKAMLLATRKWEMILYSLIQYLKNRTMSSRILLIPQDQMARLIQTVEENLESAKKKKGKTTRSSYPVITSADI